MCNDYEQHVAYQAYVEMMQAEALKGRPDAGGAWRTADDIQIGDPGPAIRVAAPGEVEVVPMRFGWPAPRPKASPVFNLRSEGRSFAESKRCLIPASPFFEFTGTKYPKTKHRFTLADDQPFAVAGHSRPVECKDDDDAIEHTAAVIDRHALEVWQDDRFVWRFEGVGRWGRV